MVVSRSPNRLWIYLCMTGLGGSLLWKTIQFVSVEPIGQQTLELELHPAFEVPQVVVRKTSSTQNETTTTSTTAKSLPILLPFNNTSDAEVQVEFIQREQNRASVETARTSPHTTTHTKHKHLYNAGTIFEDDDNDHLSACLLIKDDNDILNEWIAYHYHVLKLRTLVLAIDPSSVTSPTEVLNRWRSLMDIREWTDNDYMPDFFLDKQYELVPNMMGNTTMGMTNRTTDTTVSTTAFQEERDGLVQINNHRFRQVTFLTSCMQQLKNQNKTWMVHIDTDEYIVLHHKVRREKRWKKMRLQQPTEGGGEEEALIGPGSIFRFLKDAMVTYPKAISYPCVAMPRLLFGSKEDDDDNGNLPLLPPPFSSRKKFETLRWKYHSDYDKDIKLNGFQKVLFDLSSLSSFVEFESLLFAQRDGGDNKKKGLRRRRRRKKSNNNSTTQPPRVFSIHRPSVKLCPEVDKVLFATPNRNPITINHYIGSWERYNSRNDARRNRQMYDRKANVTAGREDHWIDVWVESFVKEMGTAEAARLLEEYVGT